MKNNNNSFKYKSSDEKIEELNKIISRLNDWKVGEKLDEYLFEALGAIPNKGQKTEALSLLDDCKKIASGTSFVNKRESLYVSEIVEKYKLDMSHSNILIISPTGSGKTKFINDILKDKKCKALMLVSTTSLKESLAPNDNELRKKLGNRSYTSNNKKVYGEGEYSIHVMSYAEFSLKIRANDLVLQGFEYIFCDEFHSLPNYQSIKNSPDLAVALRVLLSKISGKQVFYFTATDEHIQIYKKKYSGSFINVKEHDLRKYNEIVRYIPEFKCNFSNIEEIKEHLKLRVKRFKHFDLKVMAFSRKISTQKEIAKIAKDVGFNPIVLWSKNKEEESEKMSKVQLEAMDYLLKTGEIPEPYDFLIINSALQEGWNLLDPRLSLVIMNTTNETEFIQASGRLRKDIKIMLSKMKVEKKDEDNIEIFIPQEFIGRSLIKEEKEELLKCLNVEKYSKGVLKWQSLNKELSKEESNYEVISEYTYRNGRRMRASRIEIKKGESEDE